MADAEDSADDAGSKGVLDHVDYRDVVAILRKQYPLMDAQEVVRLVLKQMNPAAPVPDTDAD